MVLGDDLHSEVVLLDDDIGIASYSLHQSTLYLCTCVIGMVEDTELGVPALAMEVEGAIFFLVEVHAPIDEFPYLLGSLAHHLLYSLTVGDVVAGNHRVLDMLVEIVEFKVSDTGHAALCKRGVGLVESCLTDHTHFAFLGARHLQSVAHTSHSCTNHEVIWCKGNLFFRQKNKRNIIFMFLYTICRKIFVSLHQNQDTMTMKKGLWLMILMLAPLAALAQQVLVSGTVVDDKTGRPLRQVSIAAGRVSVVTNEDGVFTLKFDKMPSSVSVSHLGYKTRKVSLSEQKTENLKIRLEPTTIQLREVVVRTNNPRELVDIAIKKIPENYSKVPELLKAFYRETAMKRKHYIYVAEGVEDMYKTPYTRSVGRDRVAIIKGRRLLSQKQGDTLGVKVMGGPVLPVELDVVKNHRFLLNKEELDCYKFSMDIPEYINDRLQYVVRIEPGEVKEYALFNGRFYIDCERLAFTRIELELDMSDKDKATNRMLVKKPLDVKFKPRELSCVIDYRFEDGVTRISYLRNIFRFNCDWKKRLFATSFTATCEMVVTDSQSQDVQPIASRSSFDSRDAYYDKVEYFLDPEYWSQYNIIEPSESLDKAIRKLVSKYRRN